MRDWYEWVLNIPHCPPYWEEWVTMAVDGDLDAYERLVRRLGDMAVGYAYSVFGDFHAAVPAARQAFVQAYLDLASGPEPKAFPAWLRSIVQRECRRNRGYGSPPPGKRDERQEMVFPASLVGLTEEERTSLILSRIKDYTALEIGAFLGIPTGEVRKRLAAAHRRVREKPDAVEEFLGGLAPDKCFCHQVRHEIDAVSNFASRSKDIPSFIEAEVAANPPAEAFESLNVMAEAGGIEPALV